MYSKEELVQPFYFEGGKKGILLIHGFTASPGDLRPLGEILNRYGYTVYAPLLEGHGTSPEQMQATSWKDWLDSAVEALTYISQRCETVIAIGHSMGGLIVLSLAAKAMVSGVVSINAPIIYQDKGWHFADRLLSKQEFIEKPFKEQEISVNREGLPHFSYCKVPVTCFVSLNKAITPIQNALPHIKCPALVVQSLEDKTVHPRSGRMIEKSIRNRHKEVIYWAKADHYLPLSADREKLAEKIQHFLTKKNLVG